MGTARRDRDRESFEADLEPSAYGYRPRRSAIDAIQAVLACFGRATPTWSMPIWSKYFDTIPHRELMQSIARRIVDRDMLRLIKQWLQAPVETTDGDGAAHGGRQGQQHGRRKAA